MWALLLQIGILLLAGSLYLVDANQECVWATGRILCEKNQTRVIGSIVTVMDLDSPQNMNLQNPVDPDDKLGFAYVDDPSGLFDVSGCASDFDWLPGVKNKPELYITVKHHCNSADETNTEKKIVLPIFRVFTPTTYDYHIDHPIILDD